MTKIYSTGPYYDDFSENKGFHQIMFKPGYAVQARELTQMQTILRKQIERFGNHIFQHGQVVIPGNSFADLAVDFIKLETDFNGNSIDVTLFEGKTIVGATSGVKAYVKKALPATSTTPVTLYVSYTSGGVVSGTPNGKLVFDLSEEVFVENSSTIRALVQPVGARGKGQMAFVNEGVYYVNGSFVYTPKQSVVIDRFSSTPSCHVVLEITESIVDASTDETLLDPANGSYNYAAPGADRISIQLSLKTIALGESLTDSTIELMRYKNGELQVHNSRPKYSELEKALAERTYDESGDYIVDGLRTSVSVSTLSDQLSVDVSAGKAYVKGFAVNQLYKKKVDIPRARTAAHVKEVPVNMRPTFGSYIYISNIVGTFDIKNHETIQFWNDSDPNNGSAMQIGTAKVYGLDYHAGTPGQDAVHKLWVYDLAFTTGMSIDDAGGIRHASKSAYVLHKLNVPGSSGSYSLGNIVTVSTVRTATVQYWDAGVADLYVHKHDHTKSIPKIGDTITVGAVSGKIQVKTSVINEGKSSLIFELSKRYAKSIKKNGSYVLDYTVQKEITINTDGSGNGSATITDGTFDPIEVGTFLAIGPSGMISNSLFNLLTPTLLQVSGTAINSTIKVYANVTKSNISPRIKTRVQNASDVVIPVGGNLPLTKSDIIRLVSIVSSVDGDVTNRYTLDNGQRDYAYLLGKCILKGGATVPSGTITVTYDHYSHGQSGDFFSIDSYQSDTGYLDGLTLYTSQVGGYSYDLSSCIDFRPTAGVGDVLNGAGARTNDILSPATSFISNLEYYVGRLDVVTLDSAGTVGIVSGTPAENPVAPVIGNDKFGIDVISVAPYTRTPESCIVRRIGSVRHTMKDIGEINSRINRLEEFATLSAAETEIMKYEIVDAETGLSRFKSGYVVEQFNSPLTMARTTAADYKATFEGNRLTVGQQGMRIPLRVVSTQNTVLKNGVYFKSFTEESFAEQPLSSRVTNLNPFLVISWDGKMNITPPDDVWTELVETPTVFETKEEIVTVFVPAPPPPVIVSPPVPPEPPVVVSTQQSQGGLWMELNPTNPNQENRVAATEFWGAAQQMTGVDVAANPAAAANSFQAWAQLEIDTQGMATTPFDSVTNIEQFVANAANVLGQITTSNTMQDGSINSSTQAITFNAATNSLVRT